MVEKSSQISSLAAILNHDSNCCFNIDVIHYFVEVFNLTLLSNFNLLKLFKKTVSLATSKYHIVVFK